MPSEYEILSEPVKIPGSSVYTAIVKKTTYDKGWFVARKNEKTTLMEMRTTDSTWYSDTGRVASRYLEQLLSNARRAAELFAVKPEKPVRFQAPTPLEEAGH